MASKDLITIDRARLGISAITDNSQDGLLQVLITGVSDAVQKYCRRRFVSQFYDELYNGEGVPRLLLRQYPIQSIQSVRYRPVTVVKIGNGDPTNVQARVSVTSVGLKFFRFQNGAASTDTSITFATYPTLTQLVNAINALGHSWNAQVWGDSILYGSWPSQDLYWPSSYGDPLEGVGIMESQGALSPVASSGGGTFAELKMHTYELQGYQWDPRGWLLRAIPYTDPELMHPEDLIFPIGVNNFRIQYTAGYTTIPEAIQTACSIWVAELYALTSRDPALATVVPNSGTTSAWVQRDGVSPPAMVQALLAPYRRHTIGSNQS